MSECIVRMEMPGTCRECFDAHRCFGTGEWHADGTIWCGLAKGYIGDERTKCPVIELPEGHGRLVDADKLADDMKARKAFFGRMSDPQCLVEDAPTIVPAERSEV